MSFSHTYASRFENLSEIPQYYRSGIQCLEYLNTSGISLNQLEEKFTVMGNVPYTGGSSASWQQQPQHGQAATFASGSPVLSDNIGFQSHASSSAALSPAAASALYIQTVLEKITHIKRIIVQLQGDVESLQLIYFAPGRLLDELQAVIDAKERELMDSKYNQMNKSNRELCLQFLRGTCKQGITCSFSHTHEKLAAYIEHWLEMQTLEKGEQILSITEQYGPEAWHVIFSLISKSKFTSLILRTCERHCLRVLCGKLEANALPTVAYIDLGKNNLGDVFPRGILKLARALLTNTSIRGIALGRNNIGAAGALALCNSLSPGKNSNLVSLNLCSNGIQALDMAFSYLCDVLEQNTTLWKLNLAVNDLGVDGCKRLMESLKNNVNIEFLDLYDTKIGDSGCVLVAEWLKSTAAGQKLRYLNLSWNEIGSEGITALASSLEQHPALEILRLHFNCGIGRKGGLILAEMLKQNNMLTVLDLRWASLGDDAAVAMIDIISANKVLKELVLYGNELDPRTETIIADKMKKRQTIAPCAEPLTRSDEYW